MKKKPISHAYENKAQWKSQIGQLEFALKIRCNKKTYSILTTAAQHFLLANYNALLLLLQQPNEQKKNRKSSSTSDPLHFPFYITVSRDSNNKMVIGVSTNCSASDRILTTKAPAISKPGQSKRGFRMCVKGVIKLVENQHFLDLDNASCNKETFNSYNTSKGTEIKNTFHGDSIDCQILIPIGPMTSRRPLVSDFYDSEARGRLFRERYTSLCGEYFIYHAHGDSDCRKMLNAMGFKEQLPEAVRNEFRPLDRMAILWCNGTNSGAVRKPGLGYYIVNRLHFRGLLANKCSLARCLKEFELHHPRLVPEGLEASSFYPDTMHLNGSSATSIIEFIRRGGLFLLKPGHADCGEGIVLHRVPPPKDCGIGPALANFVTLLETQFPDYKHRDLIIQRYIQPPLLLEGRKFDLRVYLLLVPNLCSGDKCGVYAFCHPGYVRLACRPYQADSDDLLLHLTNQAVQRRDPAFGTVKEDTVWTPDQLNDYINHHSQELAAPCRNWVKRHLYPRVRAILAHVVSLASSSLCEHPMSYELLGCDFLIGADFNVWLLEVNSDPSLSKHTATLDRVVTQAVEESICLAVEMFQRTGRGQSAKRLVGRQDFRCIFSHADESVARRVMTKPGCDSTQKITKLNKPTITNTT